MELVQYDTSLAEEVAAAYSAFFASVPHCYPIDAADLDAAIGQASGNAVIRASAGGRVAHPRIPLSHGAAFVARKVAVSSASLMWRSATRSPTTTRRAR